MRRDAVRPGATELVALRVHHDVQLDVAASAGLEVVVRVGLRVYAADDLLRQLRVEGNRSPSAG